MTVVGGHGCEVPAIQGAQMSGGDVRKQRRSGTMMTERDDCGEGGKNSQVHRQNGLTVVELQSTSILNSAMPAVTWVPWWGPPTWAVRPAFSVTRGGRERDEQSHGDDESISLTWMYSSYLIGCLSPWNFGLHANARCLVGTAVRSGPPIRPSA